MDTAKKFTFDIEFRPEGDLISNAARARQKKAYSSEEIDEMCARAREVGMKAGKVRAAEALARETAALTAQLRRALDESHAGLETVRREAVEFALAAARKLAPAAVAALPAADVEAAFREALHQAFGEPRIVLRAAKGVLDALAGRLAEIAHEEGYEGRVVTAVEPDLAKGDCRIEWRGGGAERSEAALAAAIERLIARQAAKAPSETPNPSA